MSSSDYETFEDVPSEDPTWIEWEHLVEAEGWKGDDHSVLTLTPQLSTTRSVVAKDRDGKFVGSVVWNEYDEMAWIGYFLLRPDARGKGIGLKIWNRAMERIKGKDLIGLRSTTEMKPRYQSVFLPVELYSVRFFKVTCAEFIRIAEERRGQNTNLSTQLVSELSELDFNKYLNFDLHVVGRDRSDLLKRFHKLPFTEGSVLFNENRETIACATIASTSLPEKNLFKLGQLYANTMEDAMTVTEHLLEEVVNKNPEAIITFNLLSEGIGAEILAPIFENIYHEIRMAHTLMSREYENKIDMGRVFIPHNHNAHFDA